MKKRILVTGSNGLLGQKITERILLTDRFELVATSRGPNRFPSDSGFQYESLDLTDKNAIESVVSKHKPQAIIHTAAMTNVDECEKDQEQARVQNVDVVKNLVDVALTQNIHLVHLSTDFIFDGRNGPYKEDDEPNPLSYYGHTKLDAENLIKESGISYSILRTIIVYGIVKDMSRQNIVTWAKSALEKGQPLKIVNDQWRTPTLAEDLADACLAAAEKEARGVFKVSGKDFMSMYELVLKVADVFGLDKTLVSPVSSDTFSTFAPRPPRTGFILDKAIKELGYKPHSFEEGLMLVSEQLTAE